MNLATRCPSCGTVFRVGEEHLLASEGWVRCGRCDGVFNAADVLFDTETGEAVRLALPPAGPMAAQDMPAAAPDRSPADGASASIPPDLPEGVLLRAPSRGDDDEPPEPIFISDHVAPPAPPAPPPDLDADPPAAGPDTATLADAPAPGAVPMAAAATAETATTQAAAGAAAQATPVQPLPSFLRQSQRSALWRQPAVRAGLWAGTGLLALALPLQMALLWRDSLAAHLPGTRPALQALCRMAGCSVQPLRRIAQLAVDSSGLNRLEGSSLYRLQLVLHNRADVPVAMPALDLSLTDPQGQLVARRVLPVAELGVPQPALQAGEQLPIKVLVSTGDRRVAGYTLELFYP